MELLMSTEHEHLLNIVKKSLFDYKPWGTLDREEEGNEMDCSAGCKYFLPLEGKLGNDWGVCSNTESHRCGLLTFEHQGCYEYVSKYGSGKDKRTSKKD